MAARAGEVALSLRAQTLRSNSPNRGAAPLFAECQTFEVGGEQFALLAFPAVPETFFEPLSTAEREVCDLLLRGTSGAAIAKLRAASVRTVANQTASVFRKLGVRSRRELVAKFLGSTK